MMADYVYDASGSIIRKSDNATIPADEYNADYAAFLASEQVPDPYEEPSLNLLDYLANKRFEKEVSGMTVFGIRIATDRESQAKIIGGYVAAMRDKGWTTKWKTKDDAFLSVNAQQMISIALAVSNHVSNCYVIEADVAAKITSGEVTTINQIDAAFA